MIANKIRYIIHAINTSLLNKEEFSNGHTHLGQDKEQHESQLCLTSATTRGLYDNKANWGLPNILTYSWCYKGGHYGLAVGKNLANIMTRCYTRKPLMRL